MLNGVWFLFRSIMRHVIVVTDTISLEAISIASIILQLLLALLQLIQLNRELDSFYQLILKFVQEHVPILHIEHLLQILQRSDIELLQL